MANPIKPTGPGGTPTTGPAQSLPDAQTPRTERAGTGDFRRELAQAGPTAQTAPTDASAVDSAARSSGPRGSAEVFADLRAGRIDRGQAIDRLVTQQVEKVSPAGLTPTARAELESLLRSTLESDPNLARLMEDASRDG